MYIICMYVQGYHELYLKRVFQNKYLKINFDHQSIDPKSND
jgi:UDP-2,3-diacylglucosamine pyrophosphatase LpxH